MDLIPTWYLAWGVPWAIVAGLYARSKSRNPIIWGALGFFFCFLAVIALWIMGEGAWHLEGGSTAEEGDEQGHRAGETTQMWRTPPAADRAATAAWWTSADAGTLGHRSGDGSRRG